MTMKLVKWMVLPLMILTCLLMPAHGQTVTGSILGDVTDVTGGRLPGAVVRILNEGTGAMRETLSDEVGSYRFYALQPVTYTVSVELQGFASVTYKNVKVPAASQV